MCSDNKILTSSRNIDSSNNTNELTDENKSKELNEIFKSIKVN